MSKAALEAMIAALKDRCHKSMEEREYKMLSSPYATQASSMPSSFQSICSDQVISLTALISYVAHATGRSEFRVERDLSDHFRIPNPKFLPHDMYDQAVRFMVEQVPQNNC